MPKSSPWSEKEKELCDWLIASLMLGGHGKLWHKYETAISTLMTEIHLSGRYEDFDRSYNREKINNHRFRHFKPKYGVPRQVPTRPDWLPIEFQSLGNDGFSCEDIERCANLLRNASNLDELSQVETNAMRKWDVEKSPQITESTSTHPADGQIQRSPNTTHQRGRSYKPPPYARTFSNSGVAFDFAPPASAAEMANPFKVNPSTKSPPPLSHYMGRHSSSVASTNFGHTYTSNHAQQLESTFENKETAATKSIGKEYAAGGINSSVFRENSSSRIPSLAPSNSQNVTQDPATQAYGFQPVNPSSSSGASLSYTSGSYTIQNQPSASIEQSSNTQNIANNSPLATNIPRASPNYAELDSEKSVLNSVYKPPTTYNSAGGDS
ncbi:f96e6e49-d605-4c84-8576-0e1f6459dbfa [Sclerotinia trifoliorum]|uniref:F96e6e49-d605-4c84-8576-0e1f6459dbfa n=1 Tax=Sclerotinia trifoliorum TaxID=28548 RepID=A0A8H2ZN03_9HELO|nr:f96e6e49-d605-4c84-8576-0e1f6459dbfa [Sclerotinia trifoliorum]